MTAIHQTEPRMRHRTSRLPEKMVVPSMAVVAMASGVLLHQMGASTPLAVISAALLLGTMWSTHRAALRGWRIAELEREIGRLGVEVSRARGGARSAPPRPEHAVPELSSRPQAEAASSRLVAGRPLAAGAENPLPASAEAVGVAGEPSASLSTSATGLSGPQSTIAARPAAQVLAPESTENAALAARQAEIGAALAPMAASSHPQAQQRPDAPAPHDLPGRREHSVEPWSYRPASPPELKAPAGASPASSGLAVEARLPPLPPTAGPLPPIAASGPAPAPSPAGPRDYDVEMIQGLIKKLADEVNAAESNGAGASSGAARAPAIESSLEALRATADSMRAAAQPFGRRQTPPAARAEPAAAPAGPPPVGPMHARLAALAEAINARRADVLLEAILGLDDHRPRHYEVSLRLRSPDGISLATDGMLESLRDTGLLPVLDSTRLARTAQVARRLRERGKTGAVFSEVDAGSLAHDQFIREFSAAYAERDSFTGQLVLTLAQGDVRRFARRDWMIIDDMRDLGFRFALQAVTDLDMDFESLRGHGFAFVKLDASVFLEGLPAAGGTIPASDICRHLAELGLTLIVGAIDDETRLAQIFGFGVLYGQGQLFGGPRPMKAEALAAAARPVHGTAGHAAA